MRRNARIAEWMIGSDVCSVEIFARRFGQSEDSDEER